MILTELEYDSVELLNVLPKYRFQKLIGTDSKDSVYYRTNESTVDESDEIDTYDFIKELPFEAYSVHVNGDLHSYRFYDMPKKLLKVEPTFMYIGAGKGVSQFSPSFGLSGLQFYESNEGIYMISTRTTNYYRYIEHAV